MSRKRTKLLPEARDLYVLQGLSVSKISEQLGVSRNTISAWREADEQAQTRSWDDLRMSQMAKSPFAPLEIARNRLNRLLKSEEARANDPAFDDQVAKTVRLIEFLEVRLGDSKRILDALEIFAARCAAKLSDERLKVVQEAIEDCMADLRDGRFGVS